MLKKLKMTISLLVLLIASIFMLSACDSNDSHTNDSHIHQYGEWTVTKSSTCTEAGEEARYCSCGDVQTKVMPLKEHAYGEWAVTKIATCAETGEEARYCSCGDVQTKVMPLKEHSYGEWAVAKAATCTEDGNLERVCSCGDKQTQIIFSTGHSYGEWAIDKEATCAQSGEKHTICSICKDKKTESIPISSHTYNEGITTKTPTCTLSGNKIFMCTVCGTTKEESISPLGHSVDNTEKCSRCGLVILNMTSTEIEQSKKVKTMSHSVSEYSDEIEISITLKGSNSYYVQVPVYVDVKIVDDNGNVLYSKTVIKKSYQSTIIIDYDEVKTAVTNKGTLYFTVYNDYFSFDAISKDLEKIPWTVTIKLPDVPQTISYYYSSGSCRSSCRVTGITYEVSGSSVTFYFTGEKTYDINGSSYSRSCYIGWKLYDEDGYVVYDGTCYTTSVRIGEKFKNAKDTAYGVIEQGKTYRLVITNVS